jgi:hypothetical protein
VTGSKEENFPFVFQGLGFFLMNEDAPERDFDQERENPRDVSHLSKRSYSYLAYHFPVDLGNSKESDNDVAQQSDSQSPETASVSSGGHTFPLGEVMQLSDEECVSHYNRLLGEDFPWERINALVLAGLQQEDMDALDFEEWQQFYELHLRFRDAKTADTSTNDQQRLIVHDILLWILALDYYYNVPESEGKSKSRWRAGNIVND